MATDRFVVKTEYGDVLVVVQDGASGLSPDLLRFEVPDDTNAGAITMEVPLRAFAAKMVDIIEARGDELPGGERMRRMMLQEKATSDLKRIERWAAENADRLTTSAG